MKKYRIRLSNGRVVGPLEEEQFLELVSKKKIYGGEEVQIYPTGDWKKISEFPEIERYFTTSHQNEKV